jgi:hypothetical protein
LTGRRHTLTLTIYDRYPSDNDEMDIAMALSWISGHHGLSYEIHGEVESDEWTDFQGGK